MRWNSVEAKERAVNNILGMPSLPLFAMYRREEPLVHDVRISHYFSRWEMIRSSITQIDSSL
jgi:hypothetical protein